MKPGLYEGKVSVLFGAASLMCQEIAGLLVEGGGTVFLCDLKVDTVTEVAERLNSKGPGTAIARYIDLACGTAMLNGDFAGALTSSVEEVFQEAETYGPLFLVLDMAAGFALGLSKNMPTELVVRDAMIDAMGTAAISHAAYLHMSKHPEHKAHIAVTSSLVKSFAFLGTGPYSANKAFNSRFAQTLRGEIGALGLPIYVTEITPGFVETTASKGLKIHGGVPTDRVLGTFPAKPVPAAEAARVILDGIMHGRARISFPWYVGVVDQLARTFESQINWLARQSPTLSVMLDWEKHHE